METEKSMAIHLGKRILLNAGDRSNVSSWTSQQEDIATVNSNGFLQTVAVGTATVTATLNNGDEINFDIEVLPFTPNQELTVLRDRWLKPLIGDSTLNTLDPQIAKYVLESNVLAKRLWENMDKSENRDILWELVAQNEAKLSANYTNLKLLMIAYLLPTGELEGNEDLLIDILNGFYFLKEKGIQGYTYGVTPHKNSSGKWINGNWWHWEIGVPRQLGYLVLMIQDFLPAEDLEYTAKSVYKYVDLSYWDSTNLLHVIESVMAPAITIEDIGMIQDAVKRIPGTYELNLNNTRPYPYSDGIFDDGTFRFHSYAGGFAMNGQYGNGLIESAGSLLAILAGTQWENTENLDVLINYGLQGNIPILHDGKFMTMFAGRDASRESSSNPRSREYVVGRDIMNNLLKIAKFSSPEQAQYIRETVKYHVNQSNAYHQTYLKGYVNYLDGMGFSMYLNFKEIMEDDSIVATDPQLGFRNFAYGDRAVMYGETYDAGLSMYSSRTGNFATDNGEHKRGWYFSDGVLFVYDDDLRQFGEGFVPTMNLYRLPGITRDVRTLAELAGKNSPSPETWVGGATNGQIGSIGMQLNKINSGIKLRGKKSYFFLPDKIIALGSDIQSITGNDTETIIENRIIQDDLSNALTINNSNDDGVTKTNALSSGDWLHLQGNISGTDIGYYLLNAANVVSNRQTTTDTYYPKFTDAHPGTLINYTHSYQELYISHGKNLTNGGYGYIILPGKTSGQMASYAENNTVAVLEQSAKIHAVQDGSTTMMNFWDSTGGRVGNFEAKAALSAITTRSGDQLSISVADPSHEKTTIAFTIYGDISNIVSQSSNITVTQGVGQIDVTVSVAGMAGKSFDLVVETTDADGTFENYPVGSTPSEWLVQGGTVEVVQENPSNKALSITSTTDSRGVASTELRTATQGNSVQFDVFSSPGDSFKIILGDEIVSLNITNEIITLNGVEAPFAGNAWNSVTFRIDSLSKRISVLINDIPLETGIVYTGDPNKLTIWAPAQGSVLVDNLQILEINTIAPTVPKRLSYQEYSSRFVSLVWEPSVDDKDGIMYHIYQNGIFVFTTENPYAEATGLMPNTAYEFYVVAEDSDGNRSLESNKLIITTLKEVADIVLDFEKDVLGATPLGWVRGGTDTAATLTVETDSTNSENQVLALYTPTTGKTVNSSYYFIPSKDQYTYKIKVMFAKTDNYFNFSIGDGTKRPIYIMTDTNARLMYHKNGQTARENLFNYEASVWYDFEVIANPATQKYTLQINGKIYLTDEPFYESCPEISTFTVAGPTNGIGTMYVDDILVPSGVLIDDKLVRIEAPTPLEVEYGTDYSDLSLPDQVTIMTVKHPEGTLANVNWSRGFYDGSLVGNQTISGVVALPINIVANEATVNIDIVVKEPVVKDFSISIDPAMTHGKVITSHSSAPAGTTITLKAVPDAGYTLKSISINGSEILVNSLLEYQFTLTEDVVVTAVFGLIPTIPVDYTVSIDTAMVHGKVTTSHSSAPTGTIITLKAVPDAGYTLKSISINGSEILVNSLLEYQFTLTEDVVVTAVFALTPTIPVDYTVSIDTAMTHGKVTTSHSSAPTGTTITLQVVPDAGYTLKRISINGNEILVNSKLEYQFLLTNNVTITAEFQEYVPPIGPEKPEPKEPPFSSLPQRKDPSAGVSTPDLPPFRGELTALPPIVTSSVVDKQIEQSLLAANPAVPMTVKLPSGKISGETLAEIYQKTAPLNNKAILLFDNVVNGKVISRISFLGAPKVEPTALLDTSLNYTESQRVVTLFQRYFPNHLTVVTLKQTGSFGGKVSVAVPLPEGMLPAQLVVYIYNEKNNTYTALPNANPRVDKNGYLVFDTTVGGSHVISNEKIAPK